MTPEKKEGVVSVLVRKRQKLVVNDSPDSEEELSTLASKAHLKRKLSFDNEPESHLPVMNLVTPEKKPGPTSSSKLEETFFDSESESGSELGLEKEEVDAMKDIGYVVQSKCTLG